MRILLFILTNLAVLLVAGAVISFLGVGNYITAQGIDYTSLFIFSAAFGMAGSIISLLISKWMVKRTLGVRIVENPTDPTEEWLIATVRELARSANIGMPEVGIFNAQEPNAFAAGSNRNHALVALSSGMLQRFTKKEVAAVMGHEIGHVANGDMITLSLIQGVVNTFVIFFSRIIGHLVDRVVFRSDQPGLGFFFVTLIAQMVLGVLASVIVFWFSRRREYRADEWGARLTDRDDMISALERLRGEFEKSAMPEEMVAFGIRNQRKKGMASLWSSHPPLEDRINALRGMIV
jgi:heat shock protein HtpX